MHQHQQQQPSDQSIHCPQCGAPAAFRGTAVSMVCEYCSSTIVREGADIELIGQVSALIDNGSPIILNAKGKFGGVPFTVEGRLQVQYARGTWNEWFLSFADGSVGWLADAQYQFSVVRPIDPNKIAGRVPTFPEYNAGQPMRIAGHQVVVVDRRGASYKGAEGMLPFRAEPGMVFHGVDLRGYDGTFMTLDWGTDPNHNEPTPYIGKATTLAELGLFPLRRFEGWPPYKPAAP